MALLLNCKNKLVLLYHTPVGLTTSAMLILITFNKVIFVTRSVILNWQSPVPTETLD